MAAGKAIDLITLLRFLIHVVDVVLFQCAFRKNQSTSRHDFRVKTLSKEMQK